jgi:L-lactate dehydrogenase complex protein LldG
MSTDRQAFLDRVRRAVAAGNRPGAAVELPARGTVGYQGGGTDLVARFQHELAVSGGHLHLVADEAAARDELAGLIRQHGAQRVLVGDGAVLERLDVRSVLQAAGVTVVAVEQLSENEAKDAFFAVDLGISGVDYLIAETGSVALLTRRNQPRSLSLLPPVHIAIARQEQLLADLFDLFSKLEEEGGGLPSSLSIITGPSKTGDIELRLVTGVHGPGHLHVLLIQATAG